MSATPSLADLRAFAVTRSLRPAASIVEAIGALGFLQLDPIRAPARAADLILRVRVAGYRAGDLDRAYPDLPLAEDYLHVYGVLPESALRLLHPRPARWRRHVEREHPRLASRLLAHVAREGEAHPRAVAALFGRGSVVNGWGGQSSATTRVLEALHHRGQLRVARRDNGIKVYAPARPLADAMPPPQRARALLMLLLALYAPLPEASLRELARMVTETSLPPLARSRALDALLRDDAVASITHDGVRWLWPADESVAGDVPARVHFLAPFDPVVWDRRRFAMFWAWDYRFEAYTPPAKRRFGYYALPLLWRDRVVGWVNAALRDGRLEVAPGYVRGAPRDRGFRRELADEAARLAHSVGARDVDVVA
ncbi:MAG: crosslink repair DNA glycosylase YcaQ family protein [Burkholderiales bacterium]